MAWILRSLVEARAARTPPFPAVPRASGERGDPASVPAFRFHICLARGRGARARSPAARCLTHFAAGDAVNGCGYL